MRLRVDVCEREVRGDALLLKFQGCLIPILSLPSSASSEMLLVCYALPLGGGKLEAHTVSVHTSCIIQNEEV